MIKMRKSKRICKRIKRKTKMKMRKRTMTQKTA